MNESSTYITQICQIEAGNLFKNNELLFSAEDKTTSLSSFLKSIYQKKQIDYPKFYKMDDLSKLAFIGAACLLENQVFEQPNHDIALVLSNANGSLDTDQKHVKTIENPDAYYPSPAIFVYTLANICLAEISIYHQLQSENAFFISEKFEATNMLDYTHYLLQSGKAKKVINGWVDCLDENYKLAFYLVEKQGKIPHTIENINQLMNQYGQFNH